MNFTEFWNEHQGDIIFILSVALGAFLLTRATKFLLNRFISRSSRKLGSDPTNYKFLKNSATVIILLLALFLIIYRLPGGESIAISLFASGAVVAAIAGFASQEALSNIVSGVFIVIFKPFRVGDVIQIGQANMGTVEDITLRHTMIKDYENRRIIIPNSVISNQTVTNFTIVDTKMCRHVQFEISFDSDVQLAKSILQSHATEHPLCIDNRTEEMIADGEPKVNVKVVLVGQWGYTIRAWVWSQSTKDSFACFTDLNESVPAAFAKAGISIPYPHRTVVMKGQTENE